MFSNQVKFAVAVGVFAAFLNINLAAQPQAPSQRFQPVRQVPSAHQQPPSVHVPQGTVRRLASDSRSNTGSTGAATYNFSDSVGRDRAAAAGQTNPAQSRQVSYDEPAGNSEGMPPVPALLRGKSAGASELERFGQSESPAVAVKPPPAASQSEVQQQPAAGNQIVVDQAGFENQRREVQSRIDQLKNIQQPAETGSPVQQVANSQQSAQHQQPVNSGNQFRSAQQPVDPKSSPAPPSQDVAVEQIRTANRIESSTNVDSNVNTIRQVSGRSDIKSGAALELAMPAIAVQAFGPQSIGINKLATYKVAIKNESSMPAGKIKVGIDLPETVDLQNINLTAGNHEITDGIDRPRLIWTVDRIAARTTHTMAINAIPRSADPFDMKLQWSFEPQQGSTQVTVTEPRLEMKISGPTELQFGEKALYDVTISNPGTGEAEQVSVALPEALGGERTMIGSIPAGDEKRFNVELLARTAGQLDLSATAFADGDITTTAQHNIRVRRASLNVAIDGPGMKYAGSEAVYAVSISNEGDATASDVMAVMALPHGVKYLDGVNGAETSDSGMKWRVGSLTPGDKRTFKVSCQLDASGDLLFQAGVRGAGDLAATSETQTRVDTIADLVLNVEDPKGPLPTGENVNYRLLVRNRGTRSANGVNLVMQFSEGIEPTKADGFKNRVATGQVIFDPIARIEPGQEIVVNVSAQALKAGTHIFRAQLTCDESDSREIAEGTTRFFGDDMPMQGQQIDLPVDTNTADAEPDSNDFK